MIFRDRGKKGQIDLEAVELALRRALHRAGAAALSRLLSGPEAEPGPVDCPCGQKAHSHERRSKRLLTVLGPVEMERTYYVCPHCGQGQAPRDRELDVEGTECSPGVRRMMALVGSEGSFEQGREQLEVLAGLEVTAKAVERHAEAIGAGIAAQEQAEKQEAVQEQRPAPEGPEIPVLYVEMDGTGVPVVAAETQDRPGKVEGQPARTREAKLGCVFTQTGVDPEGRPVRDEESTTYTGAIETAEEFGRRLYAEVCHRGGDRAKQKVVIGDGAPWIWNLAGEHFPGAVQIVDLYHARQHLWELSAKLFPTRERVRKRWAGKRQRMLDRGKVEGVVQAVRRFPPPSPELADLLHKEAEYFDPAGRDHRMRYPQFRAQGLFVGSGVVEAGCKTVIAARLKRSGMFWTVRGANAILALRCCRLSKRFEDYWESRPRAA